ncbi:PLAT domain-containing protein, partial [Cephalotus follicularis]
LPLNRSFLLSTNTHFSFQISNLHFLKFSIEKRVGEMEMKRHHFSVLLIALFLSKAAGDSNNKCVYNLYVKTGSIMKAGTNSKISVTLGDPQGRSIWVPNLESWGLMGPSYDFYERGNVDIFSGRGPCIGAPLCRLNVTSDGSGSHHGWYCDYIEVTSSRPHRACNQAAFYVDRWLASDAPPYQLSAILDGCESNTKILTTRGRFVVGNPKPKRSAASIMW